MQIYRQGEWVDAPMNIDIYPFIQEATAYPIPEYDAAFEHLLFCVQAFTVPVQEALEAEHGIPTEETAHFMLYALVRYTETN